MNRTQRLGASLLLLVLGCGNPTVRAVQPVALADGSTIYFKREVRGHNYDEIGISADGDPCRPIDPDQDYVFSALGPLTVFYAAHTGRVQTYSTTSLQHPPRPVIRLHIEHHLIKPLELQELQRTYSARGLSRVRVDLATAKTCK